MTGQHLVDTQIKIATCNRCGAYVFACKVTGFDTMADPTPLDVDAYRGALIAGRQVYRLQTVAGRPHKLLPVSTLTDVFKQTLVASHGCGAAGRNSTLVEAVDIPPHRAPVTPGGHRGGNQGPDAFGGPTATQGSFQGLARADVPNTPGPVQHANRRPFEYVNEICATCKRQIGREWNIVGMQHGLRWIWIQHAYDCIEGGRND